MINFDEIFVQPNEWIIPQLYATDFCKEYVSPMIGIDMSRLVSDDGSHFVSFGDEYCPAEAERRNPAVTVDV